ncbi:VanW family protein [Myxococcota bacterium]
MGPHDSSQQAETEAVPHYGNERRARKRYWPWTIFSLFLSPVALLTSAYGIDRIRFHRRVLRNVEVGSLSLAGLDRPTAEAGLLELTRRLQTEPLIVRVGAKSFKLDPAKVSFKVDVKATVSAAEQVGRSGNQWEDFTGWLSRWREPARTALQGELDSSRLAPLLDAWETRLEGRPSTGTVRIHQARVVAEYPRRGVAIDREAAGRDLLAALLQMPREAVVVALTTAAPKLDRSLVVQAKEQAERVIAAPIELTSPEPEVTLQLDIAELGQALRSRVSTAPPALKLHFDSDAFQAKLERVQREVEHQPRDARFQINQRGEVSIVPSEPGLKLDRAALSAAILTAANSPTRSAKLPWNRTAQPKLTTQDAQALKVTQLVSTFVTYHECCQPRVKNIHRIADLLDGTVVLPGKTFSVNQAVGPRTRDVGFIPAPTIEEGEIVDSLGGGISQFATTLFNALFHGGYDILERQPHSYYFARYPIGHEATLSYPKPDLVFRNDTDAGVLIRCDYTKSSIRVRIFGDNGGRRVKAKVSNQFGLKRPPVRFIPDESLDPSKEKVRSAGQVGFSVTVSRMVTFADGTQKEEKRRVTYNPRIREVAVHPCRIPKNEPGYTGQPCPLPEETSPAATQQLAASAPTDADG